MSSDDDGCVNIKIMDDQADSGSSRREIPGYVPVELILQHALHSTGSIFRVEFPLNIPVKILKGDMEKRLQIPPEKQEWSYKGIKMEHYDTMLSRKVKVDDKIVVKELR